MIRKENDLLHFIFLDNCSLCLVPEIYPNHAHRNASKNRSSAGPGKEMTGLFNRKIPARLIRIVNIKDIKKHSMKTKMLTTLVAFLFSGMLMYGQSKTSTFEVWGQCGSCKARIEKAASSVDGVQTAAWNKDTKMMEVSYDASKTDLPKIESAIAKAGHDTPLQNATDDSYKSLPSCCKYERKGQEKQCGKQAPKTMDMKMDMK